MRVRGSGVEGFLRAIPAGKRCGSLRLALLAAALAAFCASSAGARDRDDAKSLPLERKKGRGEQPAVRRGDERPTVRPGGEQPESKGDERPPAMGGTPRKRDSRYPNPRAGIDLAAGLIQAQRYDEAAGILEGLMADFPQMRETAELLATCYLKSGRPRDAATLLEDVLAKEPDRHSCIRDLGLAYLDMGEKEKAVAAWRRMLRPDPRYGAYYGVVAKLEQEAGLYEEAIATLREGLSSKEQRENYARLIIHLERIMGHEENAFREALLLAGQRGSDAGSDLRAPALEIFDESKDQARLLAVADSLIGAQGEGGARLRYLRVVFLVNGGRYGEASETLFGGSAAKLPEEDVYSLLQYWARTRRTQMDGRFAAFYDGALQGFLRDYGNSYLAPSVMLMMASGKRAAARRGGPSAERLFGESLALADQAMQHRQGAPYREQAALFKAQVLVDDFRKPDEALAELDRAVWRSGRFARDAAELRMRALLASSDSTRAEKGLSKLAASKDSTAAVLGRYGLARDKFLKGRYGEAVSALSALAERYPGSAWANDALETAIAIKESMEEDRGALDLYRAASSASDRGEYARSLDSLAALDERFPSSKLAPRARFMKADIEASLDSTDRARDDFARLAESFPLHELAPRALERIADMAGRRSPDDAMKRYAVIIERYPDYAFLGRVREKYIALGKAAGPGDAGAAKKGKK